MISLGVRLTGGVCAAVAVLSITGPAKAAPPTHDKALRSALDAIVATGQAGATVEVRRDGGVWRATSGRARVDRPAPPPRDGRFRAGSVTKTFTATVVLQLVAEGRIGLDDPVEHWLPGLVKGGAADITVRHLLNHTSGLPDPTDALIDDQGLPRDRWRTWRLTELARLSNRLPRAPYPPGTHYAYSNNDYILLGLIIGKATGHSFRTEITRRVLTPLHLHGTVLPGADPRLPSPHADGYATVRRDGRDVVYDMTLLNPTMAASAGEIVSTTADLNRFFAALLGGRLVRPDLLAQMTAETGGLGVETTTLGCGIRIHGHGGGIPGYLTVAFTSTDTRRQVALSINRNKPDDPSPAIMTFLNAAFC
ncbi:serine hydrolase domain-containing protein [Actinomadura rubrisoli]|uniref:Class A beta-lactamase-related serine hydrolase n=1 Tax=Actinomadura rubrisoli TaxID=2530368 RepID=A0A4R5BW15_9ACTN|nr:serine hydrolase domain-containing protein [Actinomadura rubrisoli]TDD90395.1 class A beta-lactamase-related serine hydrolase [Actinomadura rubrisoli]